MTQQTKSKLNKSQEQVFQSFKNVSTQIRFLKSRGYSRSETVTKIRLNGLNRKIRYQHVRNVLLTEVKTPAEKF